MDDLATAHYWTLLLSRSQHWVLLPFFRALLVRRLPLVWKQTLGPPELQRAVLALWALRRPLRDQRPAPGAGQPPDAPADCRLCRLPEALVAPRHTLCRECHNLTVTWRQDWQFIRDRVARDQLLVRGQQGLLNPSELARLAEFAAFLARC